MAEIVWPDEDVDATEAMLKDKVQEHHAAIYGNGKEGLMDWMAGLKGQFRLLLIFITLFGLLTAGGTLFVGILEYNRQVQQHLLHFPVMFQSGPMEKIYAFSHDKQSQDADCPPY